MTTNETVVSPPPIPQADDLLDLVAMAELAQMPEERRKKLRQLTDAIPRTDATSPSLHAQLDALRARETDLESLALLRQASVDAALQRAGVRKPAAPEEDAEPAPVVDTVRRKIQQALALREALAHVNRERGLEERYEYLDEGPYAEGGFGYVFRARERATGRLVAIKFVHPEYEENRRIRKRFAREAEVMQMAVDAGIDNAVRLVEHGELERSAYLVSEWVGGRTLYDLLDAMPGGLPGWAVREWSRQLLTVLGQLHDLGVLHRDVKPSNLLFEFAPDLDELERPDGDPAALPRMVLADFGTAWLPNEERITTHGHSPHTPGYAPPEQVLGLPEQGPMTDVYAAGRVIGEMIDGRGARVSTTAEQAGAPQAAAIGPPVAAAAPPEVRDVVCDCLDPDPEQRPASAGEVIQRLELAWSGEEGGMLDE